MARRKPKTNISRSPLALKPLAGTAIGREASVARATAVAPPVAHRPSHAVAGSSGATELMTRDAGATMAATGHRLQWLTLETGLYLLLLIAAGLTRFWDLGSRALHHDESLHAYYSWQLATGGGYTHDPLMHGPFLFHANALIYLLFGDNDATSRFMPALFGVILVGLPWLLRGPRFLGRWGALFTSALFLISPSFLYYSRYIRHDLYTVVGSLVLFIAIVRYVESPRRVWLVVGGASIGFLLTNHEIVFALLAIFGGFLYGTLLFGPLRRFLPIHLAVGVISAAILLVAYPVTTSWRPLPAIPWKDLTRTDANYPPPQDQQREFYIQLLTHPLTITFLAVAVGAILTLRWAIRSWNTTRVKEEGYVEATLGHAPEGSFGRGIARAWSDRVGLQWGLIAGGVIFVTLFTTMFTNLGGLMSSTFATDGTLLYWLGQQDVQRGEQPWFYFLLLTPQYEVLPLAFGIAALGVTAWRAWKLPGEARQPFRIFLAVWFLGMFAGLSYAGEKMPWLIVHFTLPLTLLAGGLLGEIVERRLASRRPTVGGWDWVGTGLFAGLLAAGGAWLIFAGRLSYPAYELNEQNDWVRRVREPALEQWWLLALPPLAAGVLIAIAVAARGYRATGRSVVAALAVGLVLLQVHAAWRLSFLEGDVARDGLIYNTTSPDVTRMVGEISELSNELTGGLALEVAYDNDTSWPLQWYLRDFTNSRYLGSSLSGISDDVGVVIVGNTKKDQVAGQLDGYTAQPYVLRWHEPESEIYRHFAIAPELPIGRSALDSTTESRGPIAVARSILSSLETQLTPEGQQRVWRLVMYREMPAPTIDFGYTVYVRNDLIPLLNTIRY
ncbi:MAG TPA: flippase activity-associated protein Agl23 [Thermomicrobiales bacterium]|nr:flippase activity-associated protein Agl23 [Thermomicrobiales bacterium]